MRSFGSKKLALLIPATISVFAVSFFIVTSCNDPVSDTENGETRLLVGMHGNTGQQDSSARASANAGNDASQEIQALILTVRQMTVIDSNGNHITILDENRTMDIMAVSRADPVVLSDVTIEPGTYKELRLVLKDENIIRVDGTEYPIKVPSGEQSGLKLKGPFVIPKGKLFTLYIEFDTGKSVHWNKGQGWMLKPVLNISNGPEVVGIFRGNLTLSGNIGAGETLVQLYADDTARMRVAGFPRYTVWAKYNYNSVTGNLNLTNFDLDAPGLGNTKKKRVMEQFPGQVTLPVKQWSLDNIIAIDANGIAANLYRVDDFSFSPGTGFTEFTLNIDYPDASKSGKHVVTEVRFIDTGMPPITIESVFNGTRITEIVEVLNDYIQGSSTRIQITSYLFDNPEDINTGIGVYASMLTEMMSGSVFQESTENPWQKPNIFTLIRGAEGQEFNIKFTPSLHIKMNHENFTNNNPVVSWDPYPGAKDGYFLMVLVEDKGNYDYDGSKQPAIAYYTYTKDTQATVYSSMIRFTPLYSTIGEFPPNIIKGDKIRIEVFVLDGTGNLNSSTFRGALMMDAATITR